MIIQSENKNKRDIYMIQTYLDVEREINGNVEKKNWKGEISPVSIFIIDCNRVKGEIDFLDQMMYYSPTDKIMKMYRKILEIH